MNYKILLGDGELTKQSFAWCNVHFSLGGLREECELHITNKSVIYQTKDIGESSFKIAVEDIKLISSLDMTDSDSGMVIYVNPRVKASQGFEIKFDKNNKVLFEQVCSALFKLIG